MLVAVEILTLLEMFWRSMNELHSNKLEAALLETGDDGSDEATLDAIRLHAHICVNIEHFESHSKIYLDHDVGLLELRHAGLVGDR